MTTLNRLFAQQMPKTVINGQVSDSESGEMLEGVNVFLSYTTIGAATLRDGSFKLTNIPVGVFELVVSHVGYEKEVTKIQVVKPESLHYEFRLKPKIVQSPEVEISAGSPVEWKANLEKFVDIFIGKSENGDLSQILNPEVINFQFKDDILSAWSDSVIRINNRSLGYRLNIVLAEFNWNINKDYGRYLVYPHFEELRPNSGKESESWKENRKISYQGSIKHFLRSLFSGNTETEMFSIFSGSLKQLMSGSGHRVSPNELKPVYFEGTSFKMLQFPGNLRVEFGPRNNEEYDTGGRYNRHSTRTTGVNDLNSVGIISLNGPYAVIDSLGNLINPLSIEISGGWAKKRVADLVPLY